MIPPVAYGTGAFAALRADATFRGAKDDFAGLQLQLSSGKVASDYAGLGGAASTSLSARSRLSGLGAYAANVQDARLRLTLVGQSLTELNTIALGMVQQQPTVTAAGAAVAASTTRASAADGLQQAIELLNMDLPGRYLFAGRASDTKPVRSYDVIMNGDGVRAGLKALVAERKAADLGSAGLGRLAVGVAGQTATVSEEAAGLPFGFKLLGTTTSGAGIAASAAPGPPPSRSFTVNAQPAEGDTVSLTLGLPDGTETVVTLTAGSGGSGGFAAGATLADTAANLGAALTQALSEAGSTTLAATSALVTSRVFFAGSLGSPPQRVAGPPYDTATGFVPGTAADTVIWYVGDDSAGSPRETAPVRVGDTGTVGVGARANEPAFQKLLASLGALAADDFAASDPNAAGRFRALSSRVSGLETSQGIVDVSTDLHLADVALGAAADRIASTKAHVADLLAGAEDADPNEVAMKLIATQTRLQASYQTTSTIAHLSLVDYL